METRSLEIAPAAGSPGYTVSIGSACLAEVGGHIAESAATGSAAVIVSNEKVFGLYGDKVKRSLEEHGFSVPVFLMPDGERFKSLETAEQALSFFSDSRLSRGDFVVALGGGVVGDLAGFASSVYLRGIRYYQVPTTLLAMIDSSVGGKTGVNTSFGKNLIGTFHAPAGVFADVATLETLDPREIRAGIYEAVKQAALSGREALEELRRFLAAFDPDSIGESGLSGRETEALADLVLGQVGFKADIVAGDAKEAANRSDARSRKILNFGHTTAHALEKATGYSYFRHGEAVGYGILAAAEISKRLELCSADSIDLLNDVVRNVGVLPVADNISIHDVLSSIEHDKKATGDSIQWILLEDIGRPVILSGSEIPPEVIKESIQHAISQRSAD